MLGFIGVGNMASAIISGILSASEFDEDSLSIYDKDTSKYEKFNIHPSISVAELCKASDIIFLCVKPQIYSAVLDEIRAGVSKEELKTKTFVTIAAGISTSYICKKLGVEAAVIRIMPNTPLLIGEGASAICRNDFVSDAEFYTVWNIFSSLGVCKILTEDMMNRVISVNGSSPAYIYLFAKAMCEAAKEQGVTEDMLPLVIQTLIGSAKMMKKSSMTPDELIKMVASPNGTTLAALDSLEKDNFCDIIKRAMQKCTDRAEEIAAETENS